MKYKHVKDNFVVKFITVKAKWNVDMLFSSKHLFALLYFLEFQRISSTENEFLKTRLTRQLQYKMCKKS